MRIVVTSDTHNNYPEIPEGDIFIHCGDLTARGTTEECLRALGWISRLPHRHKFVVPGNHDFELDIFNYVRDQEILIDRHVEVEGLHIYGTPWTPIFQKWAWMKSEEELAATFARIPKGLDILITHGPPNGLLDFNYRKDNCGSKALRDRLPEILPRYHVFGHIHESYGYGLASDVPGTKFYNCSWVGTGFGEKPHPLPPNPPVVIDL